MHKQILLITIISHFFMSANAEISDMSTEIEKDYIGVIEKSDRISTGNPLDGGYNELVPYVIPAPHQEDAGSCLYMSHTGVIEWWLNKLNRKKNIDLSERYYMALKTERTNQDNIDNWRTDNVRRLNKYSKMVRNSDYPFTKGHFKRKDGKRVVTSASDEGAQYGTAYNWITQRELISQNKLINIPKFKREVIFADDQRNQWNVAVAPLNISEQIKNALKKNKAPVLVVYNHKGFWHANYIFGYNDKIKHNCPFSSSFAPRMREKAQDYEDDAMKTTSKKKRRRLLKKAESYRDRAQKVEDRFNRIGCSNKGAFYVRDSIYADESMPVYDYYTLNNEDDRNLNSPLILREYEWPILTLNHAIQIFPL